VEAEGAGVAEASFSNPSEKPRAIAIARKQSKASATQNAFAKVLLVLVDGGRKVSVAKDTTKTDPFHYHPIWETHEAENVQIVNYHES